LAASFIVFTQTGAEIYGPVAGAMGYFTSVVRMVAFSIVIMLRVQKVPD
jgi:hypothetical protein